MDIEKLIAKLRSVSKHPESVLGQAANALAELQVENKKIRAENVRWKYVASEQKKNSLISYRPRWRKQYTVLKPLKSREMR